ncbi:MAG: hypothetical protein MUF73_03150 [Rhodobacteraceae bacterium]|jgi:hypothetical protein|nr:hypothetical protein [Paracoccaceae bacterium]
MTPPAPVAGLGHNNGPAMDAGLSWRRHAWARARADLLPTLPIEVLRTRVRRAAELGLDYRTYAGVRAATGRDVVGFLFSSNALRVLRAGDALPAVHAARLADLHAGRIGLANPPLPPAALAAACGSALDACAAAPALMAPWRAAREAMDAARRTAGWPADAVILVGAHELERGWSEAGRLAAFLSADRYFAA